MPEPITIVDELYRHWQVARRQGTPLTAEEICRDRPEFLTELRERIAAVGTTAADGPDAPAPAAVPKDELPDTGAARYRPERFLAAGGLGTVYVAEDLELHREVALKCIRRTRGLDSDSRGRFVREAEITGRLEHPGVVPVYGLLAGGDGRPFYTMRLVRGETLQDALRRHHAPAEEKGPRLALRDLLGRFVAACQAVAYAHSRGVVHRDLKPQNVMLGPFAETLVLDWGLAKVVGRDEATRAASAEETLEPSDSGAGETHAGQALGTPAYMSPEQASGDLARVGPASDVFALGAILYAILTGHSPYGGRPGREAAELARRAEFVPPRQINSGTPAALEAVCLKAMAGRPEDRYSSVQELAVDVEHWLADEPVSARREPFGERARRWVKRRRALVTAAAAALVVAAVCLSVAAVLLLKANANERAARQDAQRQRDEAARNFRLAHEAVSKLLTEVSEESLLDQPGLEPFRFRLLDAARKFNETLLAASGDDPALARDRAESLWLLGRLETDQHEYGKAAGYFDQAVAAFEALASDRTDDVVLMGALAETLNQRGVTRRHSGQLDSSLADFRRAREMFLELAARVPRPEAARRRAAAALQNSAHALEDRGDRAGARTALEQSLAELEGLPEPPSGSGALRSSLDSRVRCLASLALLLRREPDRPATLGYASRALALARRLIGEFPGRPGDRWFLAQTAYDMGKIYLANHRTGPMFAALAEARTIMVRLVRLYPEMTEYRAYLARVWNEEAVQFEEAGRLDEAERLYLDAAQFYEQLAQESGPTTARDEYELYLASYLVNVSYVYRTRRQLKRAREALQRALGAAERAQGAKPAHPDLRAARANALLGLGVVARQEKKWAEARRYLEKSLPAWEALGREEPAVALFVVGLGECRMQLGHLCREEGKFAEAVTWYDRAVAALTPHKADAEAARFIQECEAGRAAAQKAAKP